MRLSLCEKERKNERKQNIKGFQTAKDSGSFVDVYLRWYVILFASFNRMKMKDKGSHVTVMKEKELFK